jgi:hypothetical protein
MDSLDVLLWSQDPTIEPHEHTHFNIIIPFTPRVKLFLLSVLGLDVNM